MPGLAHAVQFQSREVVDGRLAAAATFSSVGETFQVVNCSTLDTLKSLTRAVGSFIADGVKVGQGVTGTNIPAGTFIESVNSATSLTMTKAATGTATTTTCTFTIVGLDVTQYEGYLAVTEWCQSVTGAQTQTTVVDTSDTADFTAGNVTVATFAAYTQSDKWRIQTKTFHANNCKRYLRLTATIGGGTPAITSAYVLTGMKQNG